MGIYKSKDNKELVVICKCGCHDGLHIKVDEDDDMGDLSALCCYMKGNFYSEQYGALDIFRKKLKKIWAIIRNKDHYYSDIFMTKEDFTQFKEYINQFGE